MINKMGIGTQKHLLLSPMPIFHSVMDFFGEFSKTPLIYGSICFIFILLALN